MNNKSHLLLIAIIFVLSLFLPVKGATVAYWQIDDWSTRTVFKDAIGAGTYTLTAHSGHMQADGFVGANPIPNPDPGPFNEGDPINNTRSGRVIRGNTPGPVSAFNMTGGASWTYEGWVHWTGSASSGYLGGTRGGESSWAGWEFVQQSSGRIDLRMQNSGGASKWVNTGTNVLSEDTWHHIALVWYHDAGANGAVSIYIDGSLAGSGVGNGDLGGGAKAFYIGGRDGTADGTYKYTQMGFNGYMDELRFSEGALAPDQFLNASEPQPLDSKICDVCPDLNCDRQVNWIDLSIFAGGWLNQMLIEPPDECGDANHPFPKGDLNVDCAIDFNDLSIFVSHWLDLRESGLDEITLLKSSVWNSNDTDWSKWAVVHVCPTRTYFTDWTDTQRLDYLQDFDPDIAGFWAGISMNRGEFLRMRGIAEVSGSEYEFQESIGPMYGHAEPFFTDNGLAIKEDGSVALRAPWNVPYMSVTAPKWREIISQGIWRLAMYGDGVFQDNIANPIDGLGGGNFSVWENHFFKEYLKSHFTESQIIWMGIPDVNQYEIRTDLANKRASMNNEGLIVEPVIHEYIRFNYLNHLKIWVEMAEKAKIAADELGEEIPVICGHQAGGWGPRAYGLTLCDQVDVIRMEQSFLRQICFYTESEKQAESSLQCKIARAAGHFERPVWVTEFVERHYPSDQQRVPTAVVLGEIQANGCVPVQGTWLTTDQGSPRWAVHKKHAKFVSQNRHLFTDRKSIAKIALVESFPSLFWRDFSSLAVAQPHYDHLKAAARLLEDNHLLYDALVLGHPDLYDDSKNLDKLSEYDMVILPNVDCISDRQVDAISQFVADGGTLVLWHEVGTSDEEMSVRAEPAFDNLQSQPGLGEVIIVSEGLAESYRVGSGSAESQILPLIQPSQPLIDTTLPDDVWVNAWQYGAGPMKAVHMINYNVDTGSDTVTPVQNFTLKLECPNTVTYTNADYYTPDYLSVDANSPPPVSLSLTQQNGYLEVQVPELQIYGIVLFSTADELDARVSAAKARKWYERLKLACRSKGQNIEDYNSILNQAESLLVQIQGDVELSNFSSLITPLNDMASQLETQLQSVTNAVQTLQSNSQNEAINVDAQYKFDFGYFGNPSGWLPISSAILYTSQQGYGWTSISHSEVTDTSEPDVLHRDFMRSQDPADYASGYPGNNQFPYGDPVTHPATFRVDLPNGDYVVTLLTGDYTEMSMNNGVANEGRVGNTYVKVNNTSVLYGDRLYSGYYQNRSFETQVTNGYLTLTFWGNNVGPLYYNSIEWLVNGIIIQTPTQVLTSNAQEYLNRATVLSDGAIRSWLVIGPFDDDDCRGMEVGYGPEENPDPNLSWPGKNSTVSWQLISILTGSAPYISFSGIFNDTNEVVAYAQTNVYCPQALDAKLICSTSQSGVGWVNGNEVFRDEISAGLISEEEVVDVNFQEGWNSILIKSLNHWGTEWSFHVSLLDNNNQPFINIPGVIISAEPVP